MTTILVLLILTAAYLLLFKPDEKYDGGLIGGAALLIFLYLSVTICVRNNIKYHERCIEDLKDSKQEQIDIKEREIKELEDTVK